MLVDAPRGNAVGAGRHAQLRAARMAECEAERVAARRVPWLRLCT